ncbi:MAG: hypothetical protein AB7F29_13915 [Candidatus Nitrosocosmicus sp.]
MTHDEIDAHNHKYIADFLANTADQKDDISGSVKATITQFLMNFRLQINHRAKRRGQNWLSPEDIIDSQIEELH